MKYLAGPRAPDCPLRLVGREVMQSDPRVKPPTGRLPGRSACKLRRLGRDWRSGRGFVTREYATLVSTLVSGAETEVTLRSQRRQFELEKGPSALGPYSARCRSRGETRSPS